ncbi:MAG: hypothetical protein PUF16_07845 [Lachnospiraceae bacterium]|nr:hypothetical protein [Lachnospiraceae bacterium]
MNISAISNTSYTNRVRAYDASIVRQKPLDDDIAAVTNAYSDNGKGPKAKTDENTQQTAKKQEESFGAYDFAKLYDPNKTFDLSGQDSSELDLEGTLGQLRKDELLGQYQSLTKEKPSAIRPTEDFTM